jgi:bifunctional DNA-binding transcriptional regulator/antitoxin component of YhaV-PrlF toxin-antitoxin module
MFSKITSKYQVTIPRKVRESLCLGTADTIEWTVGNGRAVVTPGNDRPFLKYQNAFRTGEGDIKKDIAAARTQRARRHA